MERVREVLDEIAVTSTTSSSLILPLLSRLGNEAFSSKDYEKAVEYYTKAIQIDRNNHVFFSNRR